MSTALKPPAVEGRPVDLDRVLAARDADAGAAHRLDEGAEVLARGTGERDLAARDGAGDDERAGLDPVGDDPVLRAAQPFLALDLDGVGIGPLDVGAHLLEAGDEVVDLGLLGGGAQDGVAVGQGRREHRVLGAHDRHEREADLGAAQPPGRGREVVAVAVLDLRRPSVRIASTWRLTGRRPIRSPPGLLMMTRPQRARSGPSSMNEARILAAASSGTNCHSTSPAATS